jgi:hypothetical protein
LCGRLRWHWRRFSRRAKQATEKPAQVTAAGATTRLRLLLLLLREQTPRALLPLHDLRCERQPIVRLRPRCLSVLRCVLLEHGAPAADIRALGSGRA